MCPLHLDVALPADHPYFDLVTLPITTDLLLGWEREIRKTVELLSPPEAQERADWCVWFRRSVEASRAEDLMPWRNTGLDELLKVRGHSMYGPFQLFEGA